jgi:hypothetical protein
LQAKYYPNLFKNRYNLTGKGKGWINTIMPEDQRAFIQIGLENALHGVLGGIARSKTAKRYPKGNGKLSGTFMRGNS